MNQHGQIRFRRSRLQSPEPTSHPSVKSAKRDALRSRTHSDTFDEPSVDEPSQNDALCLTERERDILDLIRSDQFADQSMNGNGFDSSPDKQSSHVDPTLEKILSLPDEAFQVPESIKRRLRSVAQQVLRQEMRLRPRNNSPHFAPALNANTPLKKVKKRDSASASSESGAPFDEVGHSSVSPSENRAPAAMISLRPRSIAPSPHSAQSSTTSARGPVHSVTSVPSGPVPSGSSCRPPSPRRLRSRSTLNASLPAPRVQSPLRRLSPVKRSIQFLQSRNSRLLRSRARLSTSLLPTAANRIQSAVPHPQQKQTTVRRSLRQKTPSAKIFALLSYSPTPSEDLWRSIDPEFMQV